VPRRRSALPNRRRPVDRPTRREVTLSPLGTQTQKPDGLPYRPDLADGGEKAALLALEERLDLRQVTMCAQSSQERA
jgi:hypothetical protein